jgi:hypothetical protein
MKITNLVGCSLFAVSLLALGGCAEPENETEQDEVASAEQALGGSNPIHAIEYSNGIKIVDTWDPSAAKYWAGRYGFPVSIDDRIPQGSSSGYIYIAFGDGTGRWEWISNMYENTNVYQQNNAHFVGMQLVNSQWRALIRGGGPGYSYHQEIGYTGHY